MNTVNYLTGRDSMDQTAFTITVTDGKLVVAGPAEYMRTRGNAVLADIEAGRNTVFNFGCTQYPMTDTCALIRVALQTDYAAWLGNRQLLAAWKANRDA